MAKKILQINVRFNVTAKELKDEFKSAAVPISGVPGLKWKIFGMNEDQKGGAGIYLFEDEESMKAYLNGPIIAAMKEKKAFSGIEVKTFDVVEEATAITRGPVG